MKNKSTDKKPQIENPRGEYEEKLKVKGSFLDIMNAAMKEANEKPKKKKSDKKE